jgi:YcaO-like protein with predicted kinase domain
MPNAHPSNSSPISNSRRALRPDVTELTPPVDPAAAVRGTRKLAAGRGARIISARATVERMQKYFGPLGITRVANVTGLDCIGIPVVTVCRPNARSLALSQGKGLELDSARASGIMEAIELYHAERIQAPLKLASANELQTFHQLAKLDQLPRIGLSRFTANLPLLWIEGVELNRSAPIWLPFELVHMNLTVPFPSGTGCFLLSSNGLASGNHLLEAVVHGLCEVIERDASTVFSSQNAEWQQSRRVAEESIDDDVCRELLARYRAAGVAVAIWDITSNVGIAAYRCVIVDRAPNSFRQLAPVEGLGCSLVREVALARALTEAAQARLTMITGSRDDNLPHLYRQAENAEFVARARSQILCQGERSLSATPSTVHCTLEEDLRWLLNALNAARLDEVIVVDLTKPEFGIPVVRVVVPGLEPYHGVHGARAGGRAIQGSEAARGVA